MNIRNRLGLIVIIVLLSLVLVNVTSAQGPAPRAARSAMGTGFTYQGQLKSGGSAYTGTCDFQFKLFDGSSSVTQIGTTQTASSVTVASGLFTTQIDFGPSAFNGDERWLDISVRCPAGNGSYTPLTSRQQLTAAPYALFSATAGAVNYQNVLVVAKSGGNYQTIGAALSSITTNSATNRFLIRVAPGTYSEQLTMKSYVDIEGAGEFATKITYTGSASANTGTVIGATNAELRFLTVENTGGSTFAIAIYNNGASPHLTHITTTAFGGTTSSFGVYNYSSSPTMLNVTSAASGGTNNFGVENVVSSSPTMSNVTATASGGTENTGVSNYSSSPTMTYVTASASGGTNSYGVYNNSSSSPTMTSVTASASGGANTYGVYDNSSSATIQNSVISASGGSLGYGIYNYGTSGSYTVLVNNSKISGTNEAIYNTTGFTTRVGASLLDGGASNTGTLTCVYAYNASYAAYTCP